VRQLAHPRVLKLAGFAALATTLACYPRLSLWSSRSYPIWYLETVIFFCAIVLWGFVFAWHTTYTHRPVLVLKLDPRLFAAVTAAGIVVAAGLYLFLDPLLRLKTPEDYPADPEQWAAWLLFSLGFNQLFLIFAPFAWLIRLSRNRWVATSLTVLFGAIILAVKIRHAPTPLPTPLFAMLLAGRVVMGFLAVSFYLRGGLLLAWWWTFLIEARHGLHLMGNS
jgi:hypothetical protein